MLLLGSGVALALKVSFASDGILPYACRYLREVGTWVQVYTIYGSFPKLEVPFWGSP